MFRLLTILLCTVVLFPRTATAGTAEVREVARLNNCPPKKIEVYENVLGAAGRTVYKVTCNLPKTIEAEKQGPNAIMVNCQQSLCSFIRTISEETP